MPLKFTGPFPDHILRLIDPAERQLLGKHFRTMNEIQSDVERLSERKLHKDIRTLLDLKGIVYLEQRMDKPSHGVKGWPDFTFSVTMQKPSKHDPIGAVCVPVPIAWECKVGNRKLSPEQVELLEKMQRRPNGWYVKIIRSQQEAADELKALGI